MLSLARLVTLAAWPKGEGGIRFNARDVARESTGSPLVASGSSWAALHRPASGRQSFSEPQHHQHRPAQLPLAAARLQPKMALETGETPRRMSLRPDLSSSVTDAPLTASTGATREEMRDAKVPMQYRDSCAHLLIPLNRCRFETYYMPWKCEVRDARETRPNPGSRGWSGQRLQCWRRKMGAID